MQVQVLSGPPNKMNKIINTLRLTLRPITIDDADAIFSWGSDPEVNKTVIYPLYTNIEDVKKWIKTIKDSDNEFLITLKDGTPIGSCSCGFDKELNGYNLGCNFHRNYWHQGYATEVLIAMIDWAKQNGAKEFVIRHFDFNKASEHLAKKLNFKYEKTMDFYKPGEKEVIKAKIHRLIIK